jgi:hypothetical protein
MPVSADAVRSLLETTGRASDQAKPANRTPPANISQVAQANMSQTDSFIELMPSELNMAGRTFPKHGRSVTGRRRR